MLGEWPGPETGTWPVASAGVKRHPENGDIAVGYIPQFRQTAERGRPREARYQGAADRLHGWSIAVSHGTVPRLQYPILIQFLPG